MNFLRLSLGSSTVEHIVELMRLTDEILKYSRQLDAKKSPKSDLGRTRNGHTERT